MHAKYGRYRTICGNCGATHDDPIGQCPVCGGTNLKRAELVVPGQVVIVEADAHLSGSGDDGRFLTPQMMYRTADEVSQVEKTYPRRVDEACDVVNRATRTVFLAPEGILDTLAPDQRNIISLTFTDVDILTAIPSYSVIFDGGRREQTSLMAICGEPECGGVMRLGQSAQCMLQPDHSVTGMHYVIPARQFHTRGVRVRVHDTGAVADSVAHSLAHGLRMALQRIAGVDIRTLGEVVEPGSVLIYEDIDGGYGITDLLLTIGRQGEYVRLREALQIISEHVSGAVCGCDDGCPYCLYQYGCAERNRASSLSRRGLKAALGLIGFGGDCRGAQ
jgi:hypothetical protein